MALAFLRYPILAFHLQHLLGRAASCPDGFIEHHASCYLFVDDQQKSWHEAKNFCKKEGGYLAEINSQQENSFLREEAKNRTAEVKNELSYWIGGTCKERIWTWNETNRIVGDSYWAPNEPNNFQQNCICMLQPYGFLWDDNHCNTKLHFICEAASCQGDFVEFNFSCYIFVDDQAKSWPEAQEICRNIGGYLAEITTPGENTFIMNAAKTRSTGVPVYGYWIGGSCQRKTWKTWEWDRSGDAVDETHWGPNEPDNEHCCICLGKKYDFLWENNYCYMAFHFICEAPGTEETTHHLQESKTGETEPGQYTTVTLDDKHCKCLCTTDKNTDNIDVELAIQELKLVLTVNRNSTSRYRRSLMSAPDKRLSARAIGSVGAIILVSVALLIIAMDVKNIACCLFSHNKKNRMNN